MYRTLVLLGCGLLCGCGGVVFGPGLTDFDADLGNGYQLFQSSAHQVNTAPKAGWDDETEIPAKVVNCGADSQFIIAKQQKLDAKGEPIAGEYQYWIVDGPAKTRLGPFSEDEFKKKRKELGVPESLKLRSAGSFRH